MTKNYRISKRKAAVEKILNGILIAGAITAAAIYGPKALRAFDRAWMNDDYNDDHKEMGYLRERLDARMQNDHRVNIDTNDAYEVNMKQRLDYLEKRHEQEKKNIPCWQCETAKKKSR
ncbi:MAG: hypothetical protein IJV07_04010 [Alphaproteobacteria bacterium]|nr:hypothetical protein [Alphaproteobacteria bacterium]